MAADSNTVDSCDMSIITDRTVVADDDGGRISVDIMRIPCSQLYASGNVALPTDMYFSPMSFMGFQSMCEPFPSVQSDGSKETHIKSQGKYFYYSYNHSVALTHIAAKGYVSP